MQICHWEVHPLLLGRPPNKSEDAYQLMLDAVLRKINRDGREDFKPNTLSEDFESAVIKILKARFPSSKISGCTFHIRQTIWRKLQEIDLIHFFHKDADFQELVCMVYTLSFVPTPKRLLTTMRKSSSKGFRTDQPGSQGEQEMQG